MKVLKKGKVKKCGKLMVLRDMQKMFMFKML